MEVMIDGQMITCTPEEYMKLKSLGAFGGKSAGQAADQTAPRQDLEKRISDLKRIFPKIDKSYDDWLKQGQTQIVAVYGCNMPGPIYGDGFNPQSFQAESFQPSITIAQKGDTSPDVSDALALTTMTGNTAGLSVQAMDTLNAVVGSAPSPIHSDEKGDETEKQPTLESENDPTEAYVLSANDEVGRMIFISSICPAQYSYKISRALTFKTPEDARNSIAPLTSSYPWIPMPLPSKEARDAIDKRADSYISTTVTEE